MDCGALKSKFASMAIVWCLVFSLFAGLIIVGVPNVGRALLPSYLPNGDVYIGSDYEVSDWTIYGTTHYMDGNLTIKAGGVVHVIDGGISFTQDLGIDNDPATPNHIYTLVIQDGGQLIMENSVLTTLLNQIYDFPSLGMLMQNGAVFQATKNSVLEFPGHLVVDNSTFILIDSTVKGHSAGDISTYCNSSYFPSDYFDDSPVTLFTSSSVLFVNSTVTDLFAIEAPADISSMYNHSYAFVSDTSARTDAFYTLSRAPSVFGTANTATGSIGDIRMEDQRFASLSSSQVLDVDRTNLYGLVFPDSPQVLVTLHIRYKTDPGYAAGDAVQYGFENGPLRASTITITDTAAPYDTSINDYAEKTASLPSMSSEDLSHLNGRLTNTAPSDSIYVDRLWFTAEFAEPTYYNITMAAGTKFTAIDTYLGVDFSDHVNIGTSYTHNMLSALDASECYLYGVRVDMIDIASPLANRMPAYSAKDTSVSFTPLTKSPSDNTNGLIRNLTVYDAVYYTVGAARTLALDEFNVSDLSGQISSAILSVSYNTDPAYTADNYFRWNKEGGTPQNTSIRPTPTSTRVNATYDLYDAGVHSLQDLADLNVSFTNSRAVSIYVDRIWITVTLRPTIYIYRWANVTVNDAQNLPVSGADVNAFLQLGGAAAEYFTPSGVQSYPPPEVLDYLQRTSIDYTLTGPDGNVRIPLLSEFINQTNMPNSQIVGDYLLNISYENLTFSWFYAEAGVSFNPYPALDLSDQQRDVNVVLTDLYLDKPDLTVSSIVTDPTTIYINDTVTINALIENLGLTGARNVFVSFFDGSILIGNATIGSLGPSGADTVSVSWIASIAGTHTITVKVDPLGRIIESHKNNNERSIQVAVLPNLPELAITSAAITFSPQPAWTDQLVTAYVNVSNVLGLADAMNVQVAFYIGDPASGGQLLGTSTVYVAAGTTSLTTFSWTSTQIGTYSIFVVVNPLHNPQEYTYANNQASKSITVNLTITPFDLVVENTDVFTYSDATFYHCGKIIIRDSGTLIIDHATLTVQQTRANQYQIYIMDNGRLILDAGTLNSNYDLWIYASDAAGIQMTGSNIGATLNIKLDGASTLSAAGSTIGADIITPSTSNAVIVAINTQFLRSWSGFGGNAVAKLTSISIPSIDPKEGAVVYIYRTVTVTVVDGTGNPLAGAAVNIRWYLNGTLFSSGTSGADGKILFYPLNTIVTASAIHCLGNYILNASFTFGTSTYYAAEQPVALRPYSEPLTVQDESVTMTISQALPDPSVSAAGMSTYPTAIYTGHVIMVNVTVNNTVGIVPATDVEIRLYLGNPLSGGTLIGTQTVTVAAGGSVILTFYWVPTEVGDFALYAWVHPEVTRPDINDANNLAYIDVTVELSTTSYDLVIQGSMVVIISDTTYIQRGNVLIQDNGQLILENAILQIEENDDNEFMMLMTDDSQLTMMDSSLLSNHEFWVYMSGNAAITADPSVFGTSVMLSMDGSSSLTANDCIIGSEIMAPSSSYANLYVKNSTMSAALIDFGGHAVANLVSINIPSIQPLENAIVYHYRTVIVTVCDGTGHALVGVEVTLRFYQNGTVFATETTDSLGMVEFHALCGIITASTSNFVGNYILNATYVYGGEDYFAAEQAVTLQPYVEPLVVADVSVDMTVEESLPDLSIAAGDISVQPTVIFTGRVVYVNATVHNIGVVDAQDIEVWLFVGADRVATAIIDVPVGGTAVAHFQWIPALPGSFNLTVWANPAGDMPEVGLANNIASVTVTVDVQTASADLVVEDNMVVVLNGTTLTYGRVVVRDNGTLYITNGGLSINQATDNAYAIFIYDNGKVYFSSAVLSSNRAIWMYVFANGMVSMDRTTAYAQISIRLEGNAKLSFESSVVACDVVAPTGSNAQLTARNTTFQTTWSHFGGNAVAKLTGVIIPAVRLAENAIAYHYRWVNVTVLDGTQAPLPNATVQLRWNVNGTLYQTKMSNSKGYALFEALSDMVYPPSATTFYGNYKLNATFWFEGQRFDSVRYIFTSLAPYSEPLLRNDKFVQLHIAGALPDLDPPFYVTSPNGTNPNRGDPVTLTVDVSNQGVVPANNVLVRFKDNATKIVDIIIPKIVPHQTVRLQTVWTAVNPGIHNLSVIVDPDGAIPEMEEHNNENSTTVTVWGIAELSITMIDVTVVPSSPGTNTSTTISIVVHNIGDKDANNLNWSLTDIVPIGPQPVVRYFKMNVAAGGTTNAAVSWGPTVPGAHTLLIKLNVGIPPIPENVHSNNNVSYPVTVRNYADFSATGLQFTPSMPHVGDLLYIDATVTNVGETTATQVLVYYWLGAAGTGTLIDQKVISQINPQQTIITRGQWLITPNTAGKIQDRTITVQVDPLNQIQKIGHANGIFSGSVRVIDMRPELSFEGGINVTAGGHSVNETTEGQTLVLWATVHNDGYSTASNARVQFRINGTDGVIWSLGNVTTTIPSNESKVVQLTWRVTSTKGNYTLGAVIIGTSNHLERLFEVKQATPIIEMTLPSGPQYKPDVDISVYGYVKKSTVDPQPLQGVQVTAILRNMIGGTLVVGVTKTTAANGYYSVTVHVPVNLQGDYRVYIQAILGGQTYENHQDISVAAQASETSMPFWVWILIILFVLAIIVAFSIYLYRYGLGKMVECGECGALIPESSKKCPKCGTEFETGTAKCSQCGAWIPITATECTECGARFVTEPMAEEEDEYIRGMRQQYGAHVDTFREQGKAVLGKKYNESRFMEWWKKQSSYVSFEKWLSQEEEKRKLATGAAAFPCSICGTLNPKGSTVCHKCGTVFDQKAEGMESPIEGEQKPMRRIVRRPAEKKLIPKKEAKPEEPKSEEELPEQLPTEGPGDQAPPPG